MTTDGRWSADPRTAADAAGYWHEEGMLVLAEGAHNQLTDRDLAPEPDAPRPGKPESFPGPGNKVRSAQRS